MKKIGLELPTVLGMGISGPVLAFLTATLFVAFGSVFHWPDGAYPIIMLALSGLLAIFPVVKTEYGSLLKVVMWPVATVMIFASAWGSSTGLSLGTEKLSDVSYPMTASAPAEPTGVATNDEDLVNPRLPDEVMFNLKPSAVKGGFFKRLRD